MKVLDTLFKKNKKLVIGLMSGTSADGIDAVLVRIEHSGTRSRVEQISFQTYPYPKGFKAFLLRNSDASTARLDDICRLDMLIAMFFADAVKSIARKSGYRVNDIDLIGSHGQTIHHLPAPVKKFGRTVHSTLQIGNPSAIAKFTGIVTVGDFRAGDVATGGSGAPLVPLFDYLMIRSVNKNRAALNIGGIANITVLPKKCTIGDVRAFDTGPGNMIVDGLMKHLYGTPIDKDGATASRGKLLPSLLRWISSHPFFKMPPPKSTGREMFGDAFVKNILQQSRREKKEDVIATVSEFTALSIYSSYIKFIRRTTRLDEVFVSGGGVHNRYIMNTLQRYFDPVRIHSTDALRISPDAKEAICFALLANETLAGNHGNVPSATGAGRPTVLGSICLP